jgi:ENTH domain
MPLFKALTSVRDKLTLTPNELLLKEATSNDDISVSNTTLYQIADLTFHPSECPRVMEAIWHSIRAPRQEWRRIQRGLIIADFVMKFGNARSVQELRDYIERLRPLKDFKFSDADGERGAIIRDKARYLLEILPDFKKIEEEREKAKKHKNKCVGMTKDQANRTYYSRNSNENDVRGEGNYKNKLQKTTNEETKVEKTSKEEIKVEKVIENTLSYNNPPVTQNKTDPKTEEFKNPSAQAPYFPEVKLDPLSNIYNPQSAYPSTENKVYNSHILSYANNTGLNYSTSGSNNKNPGLISSNPVPIYNPEAIYSTPSGYNGPIQGFNPSNVHGNPYTTNFNYPPIPEYNPGQSSYQSSYPQPYPSYNYSSAPQTLTTKTTFKHNLPSAKDQTESSKPRQAPIDLETMLMNLDGLESSLSKKNNK